MKLSFVLMVLYLLSGCAGHKPITKSTEQLINDNTGVLYANPPSFFKGILPGADVIGLKFTAIDGNKLNKDQNPWEIEVSAGDHEIECLCYGTLNRAFMKTIRISEVASFLIHVKPGRRYQAVAELASHGCTVEFKNLDSE